MSKWAGNTNHKFLQLPNRTMFIYNTRDSYHTAELCFSLLRELDDPKLNGQGKYFHEWVEPLQQAVINMQRRGMYLNKEAKHQYHMGLRKQLNSVDSAIELHADTHGFTFDNVNSNQQLGRFLFDHLKLRGGKKTKMGHQWQVDQHALMGVLKQLRKRDEPHRVMLHNFFHRSRINTILDRYMKLEVGLDGRVRANVKLTGTKTFRYAYAEPALQQFPPECRHVFEASPGKVFISADHSQLEARLLAILANDVVSLDVFDRGGDVHAQNARDLLGLSEEEWSGLGEAARPRRNLAKGFLYRISYGGEGAMDKEKLFCPCFRCAEEVDEAHVLTRPKMLAAEARWFTAHHAVRVWQDQLLADIKRHHCYDSPFGVRRWIAEPWSKDLEKEAKNIPMQMNAALLMNRHQVRLDRIGFPIILQMHDEFMAEVDESPGSHVDQMQADLKGVMETPVPELGNVVFPTDAGIGHNWSEVK